MHETSGASHMGTLALGGRLRVQRLAFGAMRLTGDGVWGPPRNEAEARRVLQRAVDLGVRFIDTADSYGPYLSEALIAEALSPYREGLVIATKAGLERPGPGEWERNARPEHIRDACIGSLRRLRVDCIDVYQLHAPDPEVPYEDSVGALADLQREGKIRHAGVSNVSVTLLERARAVMPIVSVQNRYNLMDRKHDAVLRYCEREGLAFIPWYPLATGELASGRGVLARVAEAHEALPSQIALAWLLHRSPVTLPIPGTSKVAHLEENMAAASILLSAEEMRRLDEAGGPPA